MVGVIEQGKKGLARGLVKYKLSMIIWHMGNKDSSKAKAKKE